MHKARLYKPLSIIISCIIFASATSVTVYADEPPIYAENGETVVHQGDFTYINISNEYAVGADTGGQVTVNGNVYYTSPDRHIGAAVSAENSNDANLPSKIVITGNVESTDSKVVVTKDNAIVEIGGDVTGPYGDSDVAIQAEDNSTVKVKGDVTGLNAVDVSDSATVEIGGDIYGTVQALGGTSNVKGDIAGSTWIGEGTVTVGGSISNGGVMYVVDTAQDQGTVVAGDSISSISVLILDPGITEAAPQIVAYKIENPEVNVMSAGGDEEAIANSVLNAIQYIIHIQGDDCYTMEGAGEATGYGGVRYKTMTKPSSVTITVDSEHYLEGNQAVTVTVDPDNPSRYIVTLNTYEGGIDLQVIRKAIEDATDGDVEIEISDPSKEKDLDLSGSGGIDLTKAAILRDIKNTPSGGVLRIKADRIACFDREMLEAFAARGDIDIELTFPYNGKMIRVFIPRGTDIEKLLDEKGYCGYLRLIGILGFEEL